MSSDTPGDSSVTLPLLREIISTGHVTTDNGESIDLHSQASTETGANLQRLIQAMGARTTLEIGLAFGISALFICDALTRQGGTVRHFAIDPCQHDEWWRGIGVLNLKRAGFEGIVDFREMPAHQAIPDLEREGVAIDFAFVDGMHTFDYTIVDLFLVDRLLRIGGIVVIDDAEWPGVRKAIRYFIQNRGYEVVECWGKPDPAIAASARTWRLRRMAQRVARWLPPIGRFAKPELSMRDESMGLTPESRCVALRKTKEDDLRGYFGHSPF